MRTLISTLILALMLAAPAAAEIDLAVTGVGIEDAGGGLADVVIYVDLRAHGFVAPHTADVTLILDGVIHEALWIDYSIYEAQGCTYVADWQGIGPTCIDDPGCDVWTINGQMYPGDCILVFAGGTPLACYCCHYWIGIIHDVYLAGVALLQVAVDHAQAVQETIEDNNVFSLESPIAVDVETWSKIKGLYR